MNDLDIIVQSFDSLRELTKKRHIFFDDVNEKFRADLLSFIVGETLSIQDGKPVIGNNLYKRWLMKLKTKGFDYEIDFKK